MNSGTIVSLFRYPQKRMPSISEQKIVLLEGAGIEGDFHADGGDRQIAFMTAEGRAWMQQQEIQGHCFKRYKENILLEGLCLTDVEPGDLLMCDDVVLEFSSAIKRCHPDICSLAASDITCRLSEYVRFARVKKGGMIRTGMKVYIR